MRPSRVHKNSDKGGVEHQNLTESSSMRGSTKKGGNNRSMKLLKRKKSKGNLLREKKALICGSGIWGTAAKSPDPHPSNPNPKPPWKDENESPGTIEQVTMEWETKERILAPKFIKSRNPSTCVPPEEFLRDSPNNSKKKKELEARTVDQNSGACRNSPTFVWASSSQFAKDRTYTERVHWEPPCKLTMAKDE